MINIGGKFYSNISTKYRDITSHETSANGWTENVCFHCLK